MMDNFIQHFLHEPLLLIGGIVAFVLCAVSLLYFLGQRKRYGSLFGFATNARKATASISLIVLISVVIYSLTPYTPPSPDELAIVLGNTQNTPTPKISQDVSDIVESVMLRHSGESVDEMVDSIKLVSAVKHPEVMDLDASELKLREIGNNNSNAKRSAEINIESIATKINALKPTDNGANYLEAILEARNNVKEGSTIIVIGSGLSDTGDLNFSQGNMLIDEQERKQNTLNIKKKYGHDYLENYNIVFYGLGDTALPQEDLSNKQKETVRAIYKDVVRGLGGEMTISTKTLTGNAVETNYVVGTTDTGCGDIGLVFDDESLKFVSNRAVFADSSVAKGSLTSIKNLWDKYSATIQTVQVDGYIAHYAGPDNLSQQRAELVKNALVGLGVPGTKINASGRGFGPHQQDAQNRMVKVTISRNNDQCND
jgi:OmpA-OmpF porin, OOP family